MIKFFSAFLGVIFAFSASAAVVEVPASPVSLEVPKLAQIASPGLAPLEQTRLPELPEIANVIVDVRGARGGNGDVAASYLTATDMIARKSLASRAPTFRFLMDEDAEQILSKMLGRAISPGDSVFLGRIQFHDADSLPKDEPADLYLTLANPTGKLQHPKDLRRSAKRKPKGFIPVSDKTVVVAQTVLGNTEDSYGNSPFALVQVGDAKLKMEPAGLAPHEQGIYGDYVARKLRGRSQEEVRAYALAQVDRMPSERDRGVLRDILEGRSYKGSEFGLVYSIHSDQQKEQFSRYLESLVDAAQAGGKSYALASPLSFSRDDVPGWLREKVVIVDQASSLPREAEPGKVYFIQTGPLPHRAFVALMAYSQIPPVVAGDGALSAAIALGKPFISTRVDWNEWNLDKLVERLNESNEDEYSRQLMRDVFHDVKLERGLAVAQHAKLFERLAARIPTLTDNLVAAVNAARALEKTRLPAESLVALVRDEVLKEDLLRARAGRPSPRGLSFDRAWARFRAFLAGL